MGYHVFMDNYYNSVNLSQQLFDMKTITCGTVRQNRGLPKELKEEQKKLKRGEMTFRRDGDVMMLSWMDKRVISMVSTAHSATMVQVTDKRDNTKFKPEVVAEYNRYMHGVDNADQYLSLYPFMRKTVKWPKKLFFHILLCTLFNSLVLHNKGKSGKKLTFLNFMKSVTRALLEDEVISDSGIQSPSSSTCSSSSRDVTPPLRAPTLDPSCRLDGKRKEHTLQQFPPIVKNKHPTRKCRVCLKNKKISATRFFCRSCGIALHPGACDTRYHTVKMYY
ncbi:PiggyBac transposable element-derived protein 4 [Blattella germanica]|nr:PiggyBac transposable element-derived protein 4 [Blattella germanica]